MIAHWQIICSVLVVISILLIAGRVRHMLRRSAYARKLGGSYDSISGRIFIRRNDRVLEFTAIEKGNAYVPLPSITCSLKTTAQCDVVPATANPQRVMIAENMPSKEVKLAGAAYMLKADSAERLARLESLMHNADFSLLFSPASMTRLQIYPLSNDAMYVKDTSESHVVLSELPRKLVEDSDLARNYIDSFIKVVDDIVGTPR